jgi:hypothetical protein
LIAIKPDVPVASFQESFPSKGNTMLKHLIAVTLAFAATCTLAKGDPGVSEAPHPQLKHTEVQPALFGDDHR